MIDRYQLVGILGEGGMGQVYEAINTKINKRVAMKFIDPAKAKNEQTNARFQREAMAAGAIDSPHIVQIFDAGTNEEDGAPFIVMELLRGKDLGKLIKEQGQLELADALHIGAQILKGLHDAHNARIVHRDLKPANVILVDRENEPFFVKLFDFGISKFAPSEDSEPLQPLTRQGTVLGTPFYMSPEQARANPYLDGRTDLYAVGALLFECLTGRVPHTGRTYEQVIVSICTEDAPDVRSLNPTIPEPVAAVIARALCRDPDHRFQTAREFLDALINSAPAGLVVTAPGFDPIVLPADASGPHLSVDGADDSGPQPELALGSSIPSTTAATLVKPRTTGANRPLIFGAAAVIALAVGVAATIGIVGFGFKQPLEVKASDTKELIKASTEAVDAAVPTASASATVSTAVAAEASGSAMPTSSPAKGQRRGSKPKRPTATAPSHPHRPAVPGPTSTKSHSELVDPWKRGR